MDRFANFGDLGSVGEPKSLALGVFDGIHLGHREVISRAVADARETGGLAGVLTFEPHPIRVLAPERAPRRLLASLDHKERVLAELGVDFLLVIPFTSEFAEVRAEEFLSDLGAVPGLRFLSMGEDWRFGKGRQGDVGMLQEFGRANDIAVSAVGAVTLDGQRISSTLIREKLKEGDIAAVEAMLGRPYSVLGEVMEGQKLGRQLGFPTANVKPQNEQLPADGVWAVEGHWGDGWHEGVANLGRRPTVDDSGDRLLEVHFFDWDGDLYGKVVEVRFLRFLRGERKFSGLEELKGQIARDVEEARR